MKLLELLNESPVDLVAKYYKDASKSLDNRYNCEANYFADINKEYYENNFKEFYENGTIPVFDKPAKPTEASYDHNPKKNDRQSPGYRGKQNALKAAGLPYNKYTQNYDASQVPAAQSDPYDR